MKKLWNVLPFVSFWVFYKIGYEFIQPHPFADWYGFPLLVTLTVLWLISVRIAAIKAN